MVQACQTPRVTGPDEGVLSVALDAPSMNVVGSELVRDLVALLGGVRSERAGQMVLVV